MVLPSDGAADGAESPPRCTTPGCPFRGHSDPNEVKRNKVGAPAPEGCCCGLCAETRGLQHGKICERVRVNHAPVAPAPRIPKICQTPGCHLAVLANAAHRDAILSSHGGYFCCGLCQETDGQGHGRKCISARQVSRRRPLQLQEALQAPAPPPPPPRDPRIVECEQAEKKLKECLTGISLSYEVVARNGLRVQSEPVRDDAPKLGSLSRGSVVRGFCGLDWLRLADGGDPPLAPELLNCWAPATTADLAALCLRISVRRTFAEAVHIAWDGVPCRLLRVKYTVMWKSRSKRHGAGQVTVPWIKGQDKSAFISGLSPKQKMRFRVVADLSGVVKQKIAGPWSEAIAVTPLEASEEYGKESHRDAHGVDRGAFPEGGCTAWVASSSSSKDGNRYCARCGHTGASHRALGQMPVRLEPAIQDAYSPRPTSFEVNRESVDVLDFPSESGEKVATLKRGQTVKGTRHGPWLLMEHRDSWIRVEDGPESAGPSLRPSPVETRGRPPATPLAEKRPPPTLAAEASAPSAAPPPQQREHPHVFICGVARSGTTLLVDILGMHPGLTPVYETEFVTYILLKLLETKEDLLYPAFHDEVCRIMEEWTSKLPRLKSGKDPDEKYFHGVHYLAMHKATAMRSTFRFLQEVRSGKPVLQALERHCDRLFAEHSQRDGNKRQLDGDKLRVVNKTPSYLLALHPLANGMYPKAKVIHVVRDGRAVVSSILPRPFGHNTPEKAQLDWAQRYLFAMMWGLENPDCYLEVRYEDFLQHPRKELSRVLEFIDEADKSDEMLQHWRAGGMSLQIEKIRARQSPHEWFPETELYLRRLGYLDADSGNEELLDKPDEAEEQQPGSEPFIPTKALTLEEVEESASQMNEEWHKEDKIESKKEELEEDLEDMYANGGEAGEEWFDALPEPQELAESGSPGQEEFVQSGSPGQEAGEAEEEGTETGSQADDACTFDEALSD